MVYIALLLTAFLFYCGISGYQNILSAKARIFFLLCGGYVLISFLLVMEGIIIGEIKLPSIHTLVSETTWPQRLIIIYVILTWISALCSPYGSVSIIGASRYEGALTITIYGISCILVSKFGHLNRTVFTILIASSTAFSLLCIIQLHGWNPFHLYPDGYNYAGAYVDYAGAYLGTLGNVDVVAAFLAMDIPIILGAMLKTAGKGRALLIPSLLLAVYVLLKMSVLAGIVGTVCGIVISLAVLLPLSKRGRFIAWCALGATVVSLVVLLFLFDIGTGMIHEAHELLHGNIDPNFGSGRIYIWKEVLHRIPNHLWLGNGPDTMILAGIEGFSRYDSLHGIHIVSEIDVAHNEYLNILFHQGIFALISYLAMLIMTARRWIMNGSSNRPVGILGAGIAGYCVQAFFGFSICITAPFFWLLLGLINSSANNKIGETHHEK